MKRKSSSRKPKRDEGDEEQNGAGEEVLELSDGEEEVTPKKKRASKGKKQDSVEISENESVEEPRTTPKRRKSGKKDSEPSEESAGEDAAENDKSKSPKKAKKNSKQSDSHKKSEDLKSKSPKKSKNDEKKQWDENEDFEVDRIIDVHFKKNGKREFLVLWKGYSQADSSWEPEEHMNCKDLIQKFMDRLEKLKEVDEKELRVNRKQVHRYTLHPQAYQRRMSRRFQGKERVQYLETE